MPDALDWQDIFIQPLDREFHNLPSLPRTESGAIDRESLAAGRRSSNDHEPDLPQNEVERQVAEIWSEILGIARVGRHDKFFDLGGDSLTVMQLGNRLRRLFGVELSLRDLFGVPTIAEMADAIIQRPGDSQAPPPKPEIKIDGDRAKALLARFDELSDAEVEKLFAEVIGEEREFAIK
jgi:acyl carrier protein